jgi:hypothetical protein
MPENPVFVTVKTLKPGLIRTVGLLISQISDFVRVGTSESAHMLAYTDPRGCSGAEQELMEQS